MRGIVPDAVLSLLLLFAMSSISNNRLPIAVLEIIFEYAVKSYTAYNEETYPYDKYIRTCLLVCKEWSIAAQRVLGPSLTIRVDEDELSRLLCDMPYLCEKITTIKLVSWEHVPNTAKVGVKFRKLLTSCPNLISVHYGYYSKFLVHLRHLITSRAELPKLQNITMDITPWTPKRRQLYLEANLLFKATITDLCIYLLEDVLKKYTLFEFLSLFPLLTTFSVATNKHPCPDLNFSQVLQAAPLLQELTLKYRNVITDDTDDLESTKPIHYSNLVSLTLNIGTIHIKALRCIIARSTQVRTFRVLIWQVTSDAYSDREAQELFDEIKNYTANMDDAKVKFTYDGRNCYFSQGRDSLMLKPGPDREEIEKYDDFSSRMTEASGTVYLIRFHVDEPGHEYSDYRSNMEVEWEAGDKTKPAIYGYSYDSEDCNYRSDVEKE